MKNLLVLAVAFISLNSFAGAIEDAVKAVEVERNAQCTYLNSSTLKKCFGYTNNCFYSVNYKCLSNDGAFGLKVKVKDVYNYQTDSYSVKVRGTVITK